MILLLPSYVFSFLRILVSGYNGRGNMYKKSAGKRKIRLSRETVRQLDPSLLGVAGAATTVCNTDFTVCDGSCRCATTAYTHTACGHC